MKYILKPVVTYLWNIILTFVHIVKMYGTKYLPTCLDRRGTKLYWEFTWSEMIMAKMNLTPLDDVLDKHFGKVGTPERDAFESNVDDALHAFRLGEAIKKARIEQNLTQEQLGERIGVKRAQISRLERGYSITIPTMRKVFKALGVATATIDLGIAGKVALWWKYHSESLYISKRQGELWQKEVCHNCKLRILIKHCCFSHKWET